MRKGLLTHLVCIPFYAELLAYIFSGKYSFHGIARALPRFRDFQVLYINTFCSQPIHLFPSHGSCSDVLYGIPPGNFDYPLPIFYFARLFASIISLASSQFWAALMGCIYILLLAKVVCRLNLPSAIGPTLLVIALSSYPTRYALERGQLDVLTWIFVLLAILLMSKSSYDKVNIEAHAYSFLGLICVSALLKAFTLPILFLTLLGLICFRFKRKYIVVNAVLAVLSLIFISFPFTGFVGRHNTAVSSMPGEVFGLMVGVSGSPLQSPYFYAKTIVIVLSYCYYLNFVRKSLIKKATAPLVPAICIISSCSYATLYLFSTSSNYKLVSIVLLLIGSISLIISQFSSLHIKIFLGSTTILSVVSPCLAAIYFNYRPYNPAVQFISQDIFDIIVTPAIFALSLAFLSCYISASCNYVAGKS